MRADVYQKITNEIIAELERGVRPWHKPWNAGHGNGRITRPLRANAVPYQGINVLILWSAAIDKGYSAPFWMTYKQAAALRAHVRKGEQGSLVVYADKIRKTEPDSHTGEGAERIIPFMKGYTVFNVEQIDGLPDHFYGKPLASQNISARIPALEAFFRDTRAHVLHGGNRACYIPSEDIIRLPCFEFFRDAEAYYATRAHETIHWTRHQNRLERDFGRRRFGDEGYAMEELVAELGAAFLSADLGLTPEVREDHAAYIGSWIAVLKNDKRALFTACSYAQKAAEYLHGLQPAGDLALSIDAEGPAERSVA